MKYIHVFFTILLLSSVYLYVPMHIMHVEALVDTEQTNFVTESPEEDPTSGDLTQPVRNLDNKSFDGFVDNFIVKLGNIAIRVLISLSLLTFLWGLMKYIYKGQESDTARVDGRKLMLWGILGLFVMTSVWGIVQILASLLNVDPIGTPQFKNPNP